MPLVAEHELYRRLVAARPTAPVSPDPAAPPAGRDDPPVPADLAAAVDGALAADRARWPGLDVGVVCLPDTVPGGRCLVVCGDLRAAAGALGAGGYGHLLTRAGAVAADLADALAAAGLRAAVRPDAVLPAPPGLHRLTAVVIAGAAPEATARDGEA